MKSLLILLLISFSLPSIAGINGKFQTIVFDILGKEWAQQQAGYGLSIIDIESGKIIDQEFVQPDKVIYPASTIKTLIAVAVLKQIELGRYNFNTLVKIDQVNATTECRYWNCDLYGPGRSLRVETLLWDMITVSNNLATNQLIDLAGKEFINSVAEKIQSPSLKVFRKVYDDVDPEPEITRRNEATAFGFSQLYREIASGRLGFLRDDLRSHMVKLLGNQKYHGSLNSKFKDEKTFYHKTGNTSKATGDSGFYYLNDKTVVIMTGLQDFNRYHVCDVSGDCRWRNGFWPLSQIGYRTYQLLKKAGQD